MAISNATGEGILIKIKGVNYNEKGGFIVDVEDKNGNGVIDTGDVFHIYGRNLKGYEIAFCIDGVGGNIHTYIS